MERVGERESFLFNYAAERPHESPGSSSSSTIVPRRRINSDDVDFNDVFGGPPRRFSVQTSDGTTSAEDAMSIRSFSSEKPVFGEEASVNRRKNHQSNDFFDDIYRSGDTLGRDFGTSLPASRIMSPSRPLPPNSEPFGASLPAHFSLPATLTNSMDYPTFVSSSSSKKEGNANGRSSPSYNLSRFSSQTMQEQDHFKSDVWSSSHASPLSNEFSPRKEESTYTGKPNDTERRGDYSDFSKSTEAPVCISEFHFSIYKWPQYEIPVVIPLHQRIKLRSKDKDKPNKSYSSKGRANEDTVSESLPTLTSNISVNSKYSKMPCEELEEANTLSKEETFRFPKEEVISQPLEALISRRNINESDDTVFSNKKEATVFTEEVQKPELKRVHSIIHDQINQQGGDITGKAEGKDNVAKTAKISNLNIGASKVVKEYEVEKISSHKKEVKKAISSHKTEVKEARSLGSPKNETENLKKGGARGKVKEFAKFFTQESISKKRNNSEARTQSCRWEGNITGTAVNDVSVAHASTFEMDTELHLPDASKLPDASFEVVEELEQQEKQHFPGSPIIHRSAEKSSSEEPNIHAAEPTADGSKFTPDEDIDDLSQMNYMIEELSEDQVNLSVTSEDHETTKALDAKIYKWSTGKKGNIRSLLSTLQYVLWAESGWKPVPLVNIIEGNGVKRAYQRAMLCLHPDKLQQKGATPHQKYTAEKVFDILQEAWDQFNLIGSI
ncbi:J domain-containing protein required for chloroplast accumulation response 1-like isoform X3 [Daucus carota subsp. sativus]|uniref:J domain-containing protein required for chloroplast accumulation response 1-like isoform X3 n=1 Tax=Daucus carota subsp. sativus TaxID=79200 RepID=UPI0007EF0A27|nr:PREDICTED: J domain-containing protein required for chloroplast accumulation response 1-like isoform X3 [Daucus carota subsp. sativus]